MKNEKRRILKDGGVPAKKQRIDYDVDEQLLEQILQPRVLLYKLKYPGNIGSIVRTAEQMGYKASILEHEFSNRFKKDVMRSSMTIKVEVSPPEYIDSIEKLDISLVRYAIEVPENYKGKTPIYNIFNFKPERNHVIIMGSEDSGIPDNILDKCQAILTIPSSKDCHCSMNVGHACAIAMGILQSKLI